jgi:hypothetical protein
MRKEVKASKKYWFVWDEELNNPCAFDAFLFNDAAHLALQPCKNRHSYYLIKKHDDIIHARCTFFIEDKIAYSPYKGSFGSIEFSDKIFYDLLEEYWDYIEADLQSKGVEEFFIKNYPVCYNPPHAQMLSFLFSTKGFGIKTQELNFHIEVDDEEFERKVHISERNRLNKCIRRGYTFSHEPDDVDIKQFLDFNEQSKSRKDIPVTLQTSEIEDYFRLFPDSYKFFTLRFKVALAALILTIKINRSTLYTFYNADELTLLSDSPLVLLHQYVYNYAKRNHFKQIDIGIGSVHGINQKGLTRFKEKVGGISSVKVLYYKNIRSFAFEQ